MHWLEISKLETRIEVMAWLSNGSAVETFYVKYEIYYLEKKKMHTSEYRKSDSVEM